MTTTEREQCSRIVQSGIGASDAANLIGVGYRSAADVYRDKTEPVDARLPSAGPLRRGIELESIVTAMYEEQMGTRLVTPHGILASLDLRRRSPGTRCVRGSSHLSTAAAPTPGQPCP